MQTSEKQIQPDWEENTQKQLVHVDFHTHLVEHMVVLLIWQLRGDSRLFEQVRAHKSALPGEKHNILLHGIDTQEMCFSWRTACIWRTNSP